MTDNSALESTELEKPAAKKVWGFWATLGFGFADVAIIIIVAVVASLLLEWVFAPSLNGNTKSAAELLDWLIFLIITIVSLGSIAFFIKLRRGISIAEYLRFTPIGKKTVLVLAGIGLGLTVMADTTSYFLGRPLNPESMVETYNTSVLPVLLWIEVIILAPVFEETFFRGFLFEGFRRSFIGVIGTIVLMSLLWSLLHTQYDLYGIATVFVHGIVLGIVRVKTDSLWSPLFLHSLGNLIATVEVAVNINGLIN